MTVDDDSAAELQALRRAIRGLRAWADELSLPSSMDLKEMREFLVLAQLCADRIANDVQSSRKPRRKALVAA
ncbi:MAG: hypothetical protein AB7M12_11025 [Hyphomonadaceae bacterium]